MRRVSFIIIAFCFIASVAGVVDVPGALSLERMTFDKVIKAFDATLVKFDKAYSYGVEQEEFEILARLSANNDVLIVADVGINEYGEKENQDLAERFNIKVQDYPQYRLFRGDGSEPVIHVGGLTHFDLIKFLRAHGIYVGLDNCSESLDQFAAKFMKAENDVRARTELIEKLEKKSKTFSKTEAEKAELYISLMKIMLEKENEFVQKNIERISAIIKRNNVTENKKELLKRKLNVLKCFLLSVDGKKVNKDEL